MRSRYTAYTQANISYIIQTMKSPASDNFDALEARKWARRVKWKKLIVLNCSVQDAIGYVEFRAYYSYEQQAQILHELSEFHLIDDVWFYVTGKLS